MHDEAQSTCAGLQKADSFNTEDNLAALRSQLLSDWVGKQMPRVLTVPQQGFEPGHAGSNRHGEGKDTLGSKSLKKWFTYCEDGWVNVCHGVCQLRQACKLLG